MHGAYSDEGSIFQEQRMGDAKVDGDQTKTKTKTPNADTVLRLDGEEDTLYGDALDLEDDSRPLTGINGRDDSVKPR
jgi:hypothetical protein